MCTPTPLQRWGYVAAASLGLVAQLWVQEKVREKELLPYKVPGEHNPADALTKAVAREVLDRHLTTMGAQRREGRAASAPNIAFMAAASEDEAAEEEEQEEQEKKEQEIAVSFNYHLLVL